MLKVKFLFYMLLILLLPGCVETIVMDPKEKDLPVVVNCILDAVDESLPEYYDGQNLTLNLFYAKGKSQDEFIPIAEAKVFLQEGRQEIPFTYQGDGLWQTEKVKVQGNITYTLNVEIPGRERIWAETKTPRLDTWTLFHRSYETLPPEDDYVPEFVVEEMGRQDWDGCVLWASGWELSDTGEDDVWRRLPFVATNHPYADDFNLSDKLFAELSFQGIPKDYAGFSYQEAFGKIQEQIGNYPVHEGFVRIGRLDYDHPFFIVPGPLFPPGCLEGTTITQDALYSWSSISFCFVTKELDQYLRSVAVHDLSLESNLTYLYSTSDNIASNIHGGLGIFGSMCRSMQPFLFTPGRAEEESGQSF